MHLQGHYSALFVDSDVNLMRHIGGTPDAGSRLPATFCVTAERATKVILDSSWNFSALFLNPVLRGPGAQGGLGVLRAARRHRPAMPVYVLYGDEPPFTRQEMDRLGVTDSIRKPLDPESLWRRAGLHALDHATSVRNAPDGEPSPEYLAVPAMDFIAGAPSVFDVYVRLPTGRFLKILEAKDSFTPDRVLGYVSRGVTHFFLKKESVARCVNYCDLLAQYVIESGDVSQELKTVETMNLGQQVVRKIRDEGLRPAHLDFAWAFLSRTHGLLKASGVDRQAFVERFLSTAVAYEDAVATTFVAGLVGLALEIEAELTFHAVGLAALLHDVGLYGLPEAVQHGDRTRMSAEERALYDTHPELGARLLSAVEGIEQAVIQAVEQHHERRDNLGFPGKAKATDINRVAEIVGISAEFVRLMKMEKARPGTDARTEMRENVFDGYSLPVVDAFRKVFC